MLSLNSFTNLIYPRLFHTSYIITNFAFIKTRTPLTTNYNRIMPSIQNKSRSPMPQVNQVYLLSSVSQQLFTMTSHPCFSDFACFPNADDIYLRKHIPRARAFERGCSIDCSARALFGIDVRRNEWSIPFSHWPDFRFCGVEACVRDGVVPENFLFRFAMIALFFFPYT